MSIKADLPSPPDVDRDNVAATLERFQRWATDMRAGVSAALARAINSADRAASPVRLPAVTVAELAALKFRAGDYPRLVYVTDEAGGAVPAFSDGTNWRRCTDRAVVS